MVVEVSIVIPCLNEAATIAYCIQEARQICEKEKIQHEIIVVDNSSTDETAKIAKKAGAKVIKETKPGYGSAYKTGFKAATGEYIFMGDGDATYDFSTIKKFYTLAKKKNYDFIIGNRFTKHLKKDAMSFLHRYIGNPVLSATLRMLFGSKVKDAHCGMRLLRRKSAEKMKLTSSGMEFASEMVIKAAKLKLKTKQIDISYRARKTPAKLHSFRDGWRHLRFMLVFSPTPLFFLPGILLGLLGLFTMLFLIDGPRAIGSITLGPHPLLLGSLLFITGIQLLLSGYFLRVLAVNYFQENDELIKRFQKQINFEKGIFVGGVGILIGLISGGIILSRWLLTNYGKLDLHLGVIAVTFCMAGVQLILNSFYYISIQSLTESKQ